MGCGFRSVADAPALRAPGEPSRSLPTLSPPRCADRPTCADISLWAAVPGWAADANAALWGSTHDSRRCRLARRDGGITWIEWSRTQRERVGRALRPHRSLAYWASGPCAARPLVPGGWRSHEPKEPTSHTRAWSCGAPRRPASARGAHLAQLEHTIEAGVVVKEGEATVGPDTLVRRHLPE